MKEHWGHVIVNHLGGEHGGGLHCICKTVWLDGRRETPKENGLPGQLLWVWTSTLSLAHWRGLSDTQRFYTACALNVKSHNPRVLCTCPPHMTVARTSLSRSLALSLSRSLSLSLSLALSQGFVTLRLGSVRSPDNNSTPASSDQTDTSCSSKQATEGEAVYIREPSNTL